MLLGYKDTIKKRYAKWITYLLIILSCIGIGTWQGINIGNTYLMLLVQYSIIAIIVLHLFSRKKLFFSKEYRCCLFFLIWVIISSIRGVFKADNYWEYRQLLVGFTMCSLPLLVYILEDPAFDRYMLRKWNRFMIPIFVLFFSWSVDPSWFFFILPFILFYGCFYDYLPRAWKIIVLVLLLLMCFDLTARSNIIKVITTFLFAIAIHFRSLISVRLIKIAYWLIYLSAFFLLFMGVTGRFNVLEEFSSKNEDKYITEYRDDQNSDLASDTRSFIYEEVISSAIKGGYVVWGNTPARGNYSYFFFDRKYAQKESNNGKNERHSNELVHLNIFTWLGIIGVILYSLIYFLSSYRAVFRSKNTYVKYLGLLIAFHWLFGWIEDLNTFSIQNFWLWLMIAIGLSSKFLKMSNKEFVCWFKSIFV